MSSANFLSRLGGLRVLPHHTFGGRWEREREGGREGRREGEREGGREGEREGRREGGREGGRGKGEGRKYTVFKQATLL